jgi:hypothetical protein
LAFNAFHLRNSVGCPGRQRYTVSRNFDPSTIGRTV